MAVKKTHRRKDSKTQSVEMPIVVEPVKKEQKFGLVANLGWGLLLIGGLAHMLPVQMEPLLKLAQFGVSVQMLVGVLSVLVALNFLLGDE